jgi:hypothetical protein
MFEGEPRECFASVQTNIEDILQNRILFECDILRATTIQLMSTINTLCSKEFEIIYLMQLCAIVRSILEIGANMLNSFETFHYITNPKFLAVTESNINLKGDI